MTGIWEKRVGIPSPLLQQRLRLTNIVPSVLIGILLGPIAAKFLDADKWIDSTHQVEVTLGIMRLMIGIQLYITSKRLTNVG